MRPGKRLAGEANKFVAIVMVMSVDGALGVERPRTYPGQPGGASTEEVNQQGGLRQ